MITLKEYETEDWIKIDDAVEPFMFRKPLREFNKIVRRGLAVTGIENGNVMACGGISYISDDEGVIWVKVSRKCLSQSYRWARSIKETFKLMIDSLGPMRITTYILEDFCKGEKMAKMIGMKKTDSSCEFNGKIYNKYVVVI